MFPCFRSRLLWVGFVVLLTFGFAHPSFASEEVTPTPSPAPTPEAAATPPARPYPFKSVVVFVDKGTRSFMMGRKKMRHVYLSETSRMRHDDGRPAAFEDLVEGLEIRGSLRKRADGQEELVSIVLNSASVSSPE